MVRIGVDLGGTNIVAGVVNEEYRIIATAKCKTNTPRPWKEILDDVAKVCKDAVAKAGLTMAEVEAIGIGSPGVCNAETGIVERAANLGFVNVPMQSYLSEALGRPVNIENDANAAAYGELLAGAGKGKKNLVCITLGTGVGGGVIIDGKIFAGHNYAGTELGHTVIVAEGEECSCGRKGCWEAYASATALVRQTKKAMDEHPESKMWDIFRSTGKINGRTSFDAMRAGDPVGKAVVDTYIRYVAVGLINMINIFQPEVICVGGGISHEGETLMAPLRAYVEKERFSQYSEKQASVCVAELENDAGIIGAAFLGQ